MCDPFGVKVKVKLRVLMLVLPLSPLELHLPLPLGQQNASWSSEGDCCSMAVEGTDEFAQDEVSASHENSVLSLRVLQGGVSLSKEWKVVSLVSGFPAG